MTFRSTWVFAPVLLCLAAVACGDDDDSDPGANAGRPGAGAAGSAGSSGDAGTGGDGGSGDAGSGGVSGGSAGTGGSGEGGASGDTGEPLLDRPAEITYACEVTRPMALLGLNPWTSGGLLAGDGGAYLPRLEGDFSGGSRLAWSTLDVDGMLGAPSVVHEDLMSQLTVAEGSDRFTLLWSQLSQALPAVGGDLAVAQVNAAGEVITAPAPLGLAGDGEPQSPIIAASGTGYGIAWTQSGDPTSTIQFSRLDADGSATGRVSPIIEGSGLLDPHDLVQHGQGFVLTYSHVDFNASIQGTFYVVLDADGVPEGDPVQLGAGFGATSVLQREDRLLVAWVEEGGEFDDESLHRTIRIGAIGPSGERLGPTYALQSPVVNEENVDPRLVDLGDDVGLLWSQGTVIYFCAGCFPDNHLEFAVFDGDDFTRRSEVLELASPTTFGLRLPHAVPSASDILVVANVTHHVDAEGASATIRCTP